MPSFSATRPPSSFRFTSDQVNLTLDKAGNPITGTEAVTEIVDLWTFERNIKKQRHDLAPGRRPQRLMRFCPVPLPWP